MEIRRKYYFCHLLAMKKNTAPRDSRDGAMDCLTATWAGWSFAYSGSAILFVSHLQQSPSADVIDFLVHDFRIPALRNEEDIALIGILCSAVIQTTQ